MKNKKGSLIGWVILLICLIVVTLLILAFINPIWKGYKFNRDIGGYCKLSYDASDIDKKIEYFDICVKKLHEEKFIGNSVWWFKKPDNSLKELYEVADSLQKRMHNLKDMDKSSFQYQTGLQQVEEEIAYFIGRENSEDDFTSDPLAKFKRAYCFKHTPTKYLCF